MSLEDKISPAFDPYLADSRRRDKHEAVVIYQAPPVEQRGLDSRKGQAQAQATAHKEIENRIFERYQEVSDGALVASSIGGSALPAISVEVTQATLIALAKQPDVVAIMPNQHIHLIQPESVDYDDLVRQEIKQGYTWGLEQMGVPPLWETTTGEGVTVAVLDTGVYSEHPMLRNRISDFIIIDPLGRRIGAAPMFDSGIHGTHVCGTIAGRRTPEGVAIGVAPGVNLLVGGVLLGDATIRTLLEGIDWAVEKGADIINMSLGFDYYEPLFAAVFEYLVDNYNVLPVVAIGNENQGNSSSPGNAYNALGVGAVEKLPRNRYDVSFFSSGASLVFPGQAANALVTKPDVVAPGVQVYSTVPPTLRPDGAHLFSYMDGTSMAAPHVSGAAALLMAACPSAPVADIVQAIKETAKHPAGDKNRPDNRWGYGLIQPQEALHALTE